MTVDREQVRRGARQQASLIYAVLDSAMSGEWGNSEARARLDALLNTLDELLAELEQAERKRDDEIERRMKYQARLAAVPALVEALRWYASEEAYEQTGWNDDTFRVVHDDGGAKARAVLSKWEQAQGETT